MNNGGSHMIPQRTTEATKPRTFTAKHAAILAGALIVGAACGTGGTYAALQPTVTEATARADSLQSQLSTIEAERDAANSTARDTKTKLAAINTELADARAEIARLKPAPPTAPIPGVTLTEEGRRDLFLVTLTGIDPGLTVNADRALRRGKDVCFNISEGRPDSEVISMAKARYEGGNVPALTEDQARQIVDAARNTIC